MKVLVDEQASTSTDSEERGNPEVSWEVLPCSHALLLYLGGAKRGLSASREVGILVALG